MKKFLSAIITGIVLITAAGCNSNVSSPYMDADESIQLVQLEQPSEDAPKAVITTSKGQITIVLYPEYCPNIVDNFARRVKDGFYNDKPVYAVMPGSYFMTGAEDAEGKSGVTEDGKLIANENSLDLWPFKGAVMAFSQKQGFSDSRFFICNEDELTDEIINQLAKFETPEKLTQAYIDHGGLPVIAGYYSVFGQTIEGFDVIEAITSAEVEDEEKNPVPLEEIKITKIEIFNYEITEDTKE